MGKNFLIEGNICGDRVRIARALHKPPLTQGDLARKLNLMGMEMTTLIVSRVEKNKGMFAMVSYWLWLRRWVLAWIGSVKMKISKWSRQATAYSIIFNLYTYNFMIPTMHRKLHGADLLRFKQH